LRIGRKGFKGNNQKGGEISLGQNKDKAYCKESFYLIDQSNLGSCFVCPVGLLCCFMVRVSSVCGVSQLGDLVLFGRVGKLMLWMCLLVVLL
jgi:hypothetical protein